MTQPRDWIDYLGTFSGLAGALLAAFAILYAAYQSKATAIALVHERRCEFELGLLAEIRRQISVTEFQHLAGFVGALIRDPENETELPTLRAAIGVKSGPVGIARIEQIDNHAASLGVVRQRLLVQTANDEIDGAIRRRLEL